jgi:limonene-1,2-epoxide hydrolase
MNSNANNGAQQAALEAENRAFIQRFFDDWSKRDANLLATYLADDLIYQMVEGQPDIIGKAAFVETLGPVLKTFQSVEMKILRHHAVGQLVVSERLDTLIGDDAAHSMRFSVASYSVVYNRKITILKDYPIPNGTFELGDAFL